MSNILSPAKVSIIQLDYDATKLHFIAEMSDLNGFGRVWSDSADEGFTIVGATGRQVVFVVTEEHMDNEGDITHWDLRSVSGNFTATVFND